MSREAIGGSVALLIIVGLLWVFNWAGVIKLRPKHEDEIQETLPKAGWLDRKVKEPDWWVVYRSTREDLWRTEKWNPHTHGEVGGCVEVLGNGLLSKVAVQATTAKRATQAADSIADEICLGRHGRWLILTREGKDWPWFCRAFDGNKDTMTPGASIRDGVLVMAIVYATTPRHAASMVDSLAVEIR
jgi:hypothetical protein